jgi:hypothetical protein
MPYAVHDKMDDRPSVHSACQPSACGYPATWSADGGEEARHCGQSHSELIRETLEELLRRREQERLVAGLIAAAEALASDASARAESLDVAADFLPADSEALALAEVTVSQDQPPQPKPQPWLR